MCVYIENEFRVGVESDIKGNVKAKTNESTALEFYLRPIL